VHPRPLAPGRSRTAPVRPRRVSGPARPARRARPAHPQQADGGIALGLLGVLDGLFHHRLLDRLLRGRISIALVAFALIGIVTLQLGLLKLNSSIGRTLERESLLQRENAALSIQNSELAAGDKVESRAVALGMELVPIGTLRFLAARPGADATRAASALKTSPQGAGAGSREAASAAPASAAGATPPATGEQPGSAEQASSGEHASSTTASAPPSESPTPAHGESAQPSNEASAPAASAPASESPSTGASSPGGGGGSGEAAPAGGTQAGPTG
jgi:hypothetical protein